MSHQRADGRMIRRPSFWSNTITHIDSWRLVMKMCASSLRTVLIGCERSACMYSQGLVEVTTCKKRRDATQTVLVDFERGDGAVLLIVGVILMLQFWLTLREVMVQCYSLSV